MSEQMHRLHSAYGGSVIARVIACAGSVALADGLPNVAGAYAEEGTFAHALAERCLRANCFDASTMIGETIQHPEIDSSKDVTEEMAGAVQVYLDAVQEELGRSADAILEIEQAFILPVSSADENEVFGANDALVYHPSNGRLVVFDYKHGAGVIVGVEDNQQLKFYASGAVFANPQWTVSECELVIVQPRAADADNYDVPGVKRWPMHTAELIDFLGEVDAAVARAKPYVALGVKPTTTDLFENGDKVLNVGPQCRWCPAAAICPAKQAEVEAEIGYSFADVAQVTPQSLPVAKEMGVDQVAKVLKGAEVLEAWIKQVREFAFGALQQGVVIPGFKLVDKVGRRKWIENEREIAGFLELAFGIPEDDAYPRKLQTITEIERQVKARVTDKTERKAALDDLSLRFTIKDSSGQTIAPDTDRRDAVTAGPSADFADVNLDSAT
jgi:hypothetical protein